LLSHPFSVNLLHSNSQLVTETAFCRWRRRRTWSPATWTG
jgi:hypothetical protein